MPLYIDGKLVKSGSNIHPLQVWDVYPQLYGNSKIFIENNQDVWLQKSDRVLYVHQGEFAVISSKLNGQHFKYICTDDATTCHAVVLMEKSSGLIALGHFDGSETEENFRKMYAELTVSVSEPDVELYLFGGFIDEKKYSENIFIDLLSCCQKFDDNVVLKMACCHSLNNKIENGNNMPEIYGIAVNVETGEILRGRCMERGPDILLRKARNMFSSSSSSNMCQLYNYLSNRVSIDPFSIGSIQYADVLLSLDDERFLQVMSTSPHCEPPHFVDCIKAAITFSLKWRNKESQLFLGESRQYVLDDRNEWTLCNPQQMKIS